MIELNASGQIGRHKQTLVKMINILGTQHTGKVRSHSISAVITIAHDVLSRSIGTERMFLVFGESRELEPTRVDGMFSCSTSPGAPVPFNPASSAI